jgi:hypothetical protein
MKPLEPWFPACFVLDSKSAEAMEDEVQKIKKIKSGFERPPSHVRVKAGVNRTRVAS